MEETKERYEVLKTLGSGATAEVFLLYDKVLERKLALKRGCKKEILRREAKLLAGFSSPYFPALYDYTEEGGESRLWMEYIDGENLADRKRRIGRYTETEALEIGVHIAQALHVLHTASPPWVYGDIRPENIMMTGTGGVKLIDFGSAVEAGTPLDREDRQRGGTPLYAPPEHWTGIPDVRGDIYALGRLMQDMLQMGRGGVVSRECRRIIERCVQKQPPKRYASAEEFAKEAGLLLNRKD